MNIDETPVVPGVLSKVGQLMGGHKGDLFKFTNATNESIVFKFQSESPVEALAGTRIVQRAGGETPRVRVATDADYDALSRAAVSRRGTDQAAGVFIDYNRTKRPIMLLMEFASGSTLKAMRENSLHEFLAALRDTNFQKGLGRIIAADVFSGNPDRMFAGKIGFSKENTGWYHEQNLFIRDKTPVAIDNAFAPGVSEGMVKAQGVWGRYLGGMGIQVAGFAGALPKYARQQAEMLFDLLVSTALANHKDREGEIDEVRRHRDTFADNVQKGALKAIKTLMTPGQGWKGQLRADGASNEMLSDFSVRKRMMRQMLMGVTAQEALSNAKDDDVYRKWVLTTRYKQAGAEADALLANGLEAYRRYKRTQPAPDVMMPNM